MLSIRGALNLRDFVSKSKTKPEIRLLENRMLPWDQELRTAVTEDFKFLSVAIRRDESLDQPSVGAIDSQWSVQIECLYLSEPV